MHINPEWSQHIVEDYFVDDPVFYPEEDQEANRREAFERLQSYLKDPHAPVDLESPDWIDTSDAPSALVYDVGVIRVEWFVSDDGVQWVDARDLVAAPLVDDLIERYLP